jgi:hypothetical protein
MIKIRNEDDGDRQLQLFHYQDSGAHLLNLNLVLKGRPKPVASEGKTSIELSCSGLPAQTIVLNATDVCTTPVLQS